jgi:hypothetical protein
MSIVQCIIYYLVHVMIGRKFKSINVFIYKIIFFRYGISPGGLASQSYSGVIFMDMDWYKYSI